MQINTPTTLKEWLKLFCFTHNTTNAKIAEQLQLSASMFSLIKDGKRSVPYFFADGFNKAYNLSDEEYKSLKDIINSHKTPKTFKPQLVFVKTEYAKPWTKELLQLCVKIVNLLEEQEAKDLLQTFYKLYSSKAMPKHNEIFDSWEELVERFETITGIKYKK